MAAPTVHICIRQTLDWRDRALVHAKILPSFRPKYEAWNATFTVPYHAFRQRLREIALENLSRVAGAVLSSIDDVPPGAIIVPVDDDDWFAPELVTRLRAAHDPAASGYLWGHRTIEALRRRTGLGWLYRKVRERLLGPIPGRYLTETNNYALVSGAPDARALLANHVQASRSFRPRLHEVRKLPEVLGVHNRSLASQTALAWGRPTITRAELLEVLARHRDLYRRWRPPPGLGWARPYVSRMDDLMAELKVR
jgi:hypothetical protein